MNVGVAIRTFPRNGQPVSYTIDLDELAGLRDWHPVTEELASPSATPVGTDRPTFRWTALRESRATSNGLRRISSPRVHEWALTETEWMIRDQFKAGRIYTWTVSALKNGKEITAPPAPALAEFEVLAKRAAKMSSRNQSRGSNAVRGIVYAKAGLLDEAEREFHTYLADHPSDYRIKQLLQTLRSWRRVQP
jgi:hypothetical protein